MLRTCFQQRAHSAVDICPARRRLGNARQDFQPCAESFGWAQGKLCRSKRAFARAVAPNDRGHLGDAHHLAALDPSASSGLALEGDVAQRPNHVVTVGTLERLTVLTRKRWNVSTMVSRSVLKRLNVKHRTQRTPLGHDENWVAIQDMI
jgi:hypothetical protein